MSDPAPPISSTAEFYRPIPVFVARPPRRRTWLYVLFFFLTVFTTLVVGAGMEANFRHNFSALAVSEDTLFWFFPIVRAFRHPSFLLLGIPFSFTLMTILFAHEMGHYLYCRYYGVNATFPFFVPFPSLIGTLGAFIRIKSPIRSRSALFDIGIAGPIAGFVVACLVLVVGLTLSKPLTGSAILPDIGLGYPLIFNLMNRLVHGTDGLTLARINLHPVAIAAWAGMLATSLNLLPGGQLDGGHIIFALVPRWHKAVSIACVAALIGLGIYGWRGWLLWAAILGITGMRHPLVPTGIDISAGRKWFAIFALLLLVLSFMPSPILIRGS